MICYVWIIDLILGFHVQQNDHCEFLSQTHSLGTVKELYIKRIEDNMEVFCTVQWFYIEKISENVIHLICSDNIQVI